MIHDRLAAETALPNRWPRDDDVLTAIRDKDMYGARRQERLVMVLWRCEEWIRAADRRVEQHVPAPPGLTLEHIIPQAWEAHWPPDETRGDPVSWRRTHLHKLGNLTITSGPLNAALSNGPWSAPANASDKRRGLQTGVLRMNTLLSDSHPDRFDEASVDERGQALGHLILNNWPGA